MSSTLRSSRLRRILGAYTVNRLGSWIGLVALSLAVFDHTHDALAVAGVLLAWQALPAFLVPALVAQVEASRHGRELSSLYFFEAFATAGLAIVLWRFSLPALLVLAALDGTAALAASALLRAQLARTAREQIRPGADLAGSSEEGFEQQAQEAERAANAALNVCFSVSFVAGPLIGGVVVAAAGAPAALFIDVGSFLICGALLMDLRAHVEEAGGDSVRARLSVAWTHVRQTPALRALLLAMAIALVFIQGAAPIEVSYVKATLRGGDGAYGLLVTSWGAGAVLASVVFARAKGRPLGALLCAGTAALAAAFVGFALAPSLWVAYLAALVGGFGNGLDLPALITLVQRLAPPRLHGQLMGAVESLMALTLAVGLPLGGALVAIGSARSAFLVLGLGTAASGVVFLRLSLSGREADTRGPLDAAPAGSSRG